MTFWRGLLWLSIALWLAGCVTQTETPAVPTQTLLPLPTLTRTPAATPRLATPVIIATDTPTPTPVTYVVQQGDTLVGIAWDFGISVEALQAANPTVQPAFLSIGTVLLIPEPESESGGQPVVRAAGAPTPAPVDFGPPACYATSTGGLYCLVEAHNPGPLALADVSASIILAGADGLPLARQTAFAARALIPPGESAPLGALFPAAPLGVAASAAQVQTALIMDDPSTRAIVLAVSQHAGSAEGAAWRVAGQLHNPTDRAAAEVWLILTLYDAAGTPAGYRKAALGQPLAPGETRDFEITATALGGPAVNYTLAAEGRP